MSSRLFFKKKKVYCTFLFWKTKSQAFLERTAVATYMYSSKDFFFLFEVQRVPGIQRALDSNYRDSYVGTSNKQKKSPNQPNKQSHYNSKLEIFRQRAHFMSIPSEGKNSNRERLWNGRILTY